MHPSLKLTEYLLQ